MSSLPSHAALSRPTGADSRFEDSRWDRRSRNRSPSARWIGWRLRALVVAALLGCVAMFALLRTLTAWPVLDASLGLNDRAALVLEGGAAPMAVEGLVDTSGRIQRLDALLLHRSPRWLPGDADRAEHARQHDAFGAALAAGPVRLTDGHGQVREVAVRPRGAAGLGWTFWLVATLALLLYLVTMVVLLARPDIRNALYAAMALAQTGNLLFLALLSTPAPGWPPGLMQWEAASRAAFDLVTAAALVQVTNLHPRPLPGGPLRAVLAWLVVAGFLGLVAAGAPGGVWWWTQGLALAGAAVAVVQLAWMQRRQPHPFAHQLLRLCAAMIATLVLLTVTVAALDPRAHGQAAFIASTVWVVVLAAMLLMLPFLSRTQQLVREFSLLAGVSTVATALDLLFVAVFSLGNFASLTLALFIALALYAGARQWLLSQFVSRQRLTTERMFERAYRMAREVQLRPGEATEQWTSLLRDLFEPLDARAVERQTRRSRVISDGASLVVPMPPLGAASGEPRAVVLGFADRGRRLFTENDARLADRVVDLITRAVAFDQAVERARGEERARIAQDLHDDIGARLLTLMYKASTPEMEDYVRHTLKDLKTLTRGLAAPSHPLSHAVAEWKADIAQRLAAADCELAWSFTYDRDFELSVVQWSALTRVLRELVSNALAHAQATRVEVDASVQRGHLQLVVTDNGLGRRPETWAHGLGLGGVRKRVKLLGGDVAWSEHGERGIVCRVRVPGFARGSAA